MFAQPSDDTTAQRVSNGTARQNDSEPPVDNAAIAEANNAAIAEANNAAIAEANNASSQRDQRLPSGTTNRETNVAADEDPEHRARFPILRSTLDGIPAADIVDNLYYRHLAEQQRRFASERSFQDFNSSRQERRHVERRAESYSIEAVEESAKTGSSPTDLWTVDDKIKFLLFVSSVIVLSMYPNHFSYFLIDFYQYVSQEPNFCPHFSFVFLPVVFCCGIYFLCEKFKMIMDEAAEEGRRHFGS